MLNETDVRPPQIQEIADFLEEDKEDVWSAIIFYKKYPDLTIYPSGKNVSWWAIKQEL